MNPPDVLTPSGALAFRRHGSFCGRILAGCLPDYWTQLKGAQSPWPPIHVRLLQDRHPALEHWIFGGESCPAALIEIRCEEAGRDQLLRIQILNATAEEAVVTVTWVDLPAHPDAGQALRAIEQSFEGLALTDAQGRFTYMNPAHLALFGFRDLTEVIGQSWEILYETAEIARIKSEVLPALQVKRTWHGMTRGRRVDGTTFLEDLTLSALPDGGIACNCRDRTEEFSLKERIERSELLFHSFADNVPAGVFIKRPSGEQYFVNRQAADFLGTSADKLVGRMDSSIFPPEVITTIRKYDDLVRSTGQVQHFEIELADATGTERIVEGVKFPLFGVDQAADHICAIYTDVTVRRQLEREAARVAESQRELLTMQQEFVAMASHEFRTPLSAIQSANYLLRMRLGNLQDAKALHYLDLQSQSITRFTELIDQVVRLNQMRHQTELESLSVCNVPELILSAAAQLVKGGARRLPKLQKELAFDGARQFRVVPGLFRMAVESLLSNALKFSEPASDILVGLETFEGYLKITVRDDGIGIPADEQTSIFTPFFRASNSRATPGTGLGLVIVQRAMLFHRGRVEFSSAPKDGTVFRLFFPLGEGACPKPHSGQ